MTLIIYAKCSDHDRKEMDMQINVKKYYIPKNDEFTLALAGESIMIHVLLVKFVQIMINCYWINYMNSSPCSSNFPTLLIVLEISEKIDIKYWHTSLYGNSEIFNLRIR